MCKKTDEKKENDLDWTLSNRKYDLYKRWATVTVPALITLLTGIGSLYHIDLTGFTGLLALFNTFLGTLLSASSRKYQEDLEKEAQKKG